MLQTDRHPVALLSYPFITDNTIDRHTCTIYIFLDNHILTYPNQELKGLEILKKTFCEKKQNTFIKLAVSYFTFCSNNDNCSAK